LVVKRSLLLDDIRSEARIFPQSRNF